MNADNFSSIYRKSFDTAKNRASSRLSSLTGNNFKFSQDTLPKNSIPILIVILLLGVAFFAGARFAPQGGSLSSLTSLDERASAPAPIATQVLNKRLELPLLDGQGKEV